MREPIGLLFTAAAITCEWYLGLSWRLWGPRFVRGWEAEESVGGGRA